MCVVEGVNAPEVRRYLNTLSTEPQHLVVCSSVQEFAPTKDELASTTDQVVDWLIADDTCSATPVSSIQDAAALCFVVVAIACTFVLYFKRAPAFGKDADGSFL